MWRGLRFLQYTSLKIHDGAMFKSFMPQKGFDLLRFHFIQEGKRDVEENKPEKLNNALNGGFY